MRESIERYKANINEAELEYRHLLEGLRRSSKEGLAYDELQRRVDDLNQAATVVSYYRNRLTTARKRRPLTTWTRAVTSEAHVQP